MSGRLMVQDVHFARAGREVLRDVSFEHESGKILTILGPSGSGKTTLLWLLARLLKPQRGSIRYEGVPDPPRMGFVFQDGGLWEHLSVAGHLELVLRRETLSRAARRQRVQQAMEEMGLAALSRRRPGELSGGERQRLSLARALVVRPQWLLLDEPTSQLDGPARQELLDLLQSRLAALSAGIVLATHQVEQAMRLSDRIAVLMHGRIAQLAPPRELYRDPIDLDVARLTGPAFELAGEARGSALVADGRVLRRGIASGVRSAERMILRPEDVQFEVDAQGGWVVAACRFAGPQWRLTLRSGDGAAALADSGAPLEAGTTGRLVLRRPLVE